MNSGVPLQVFYWNVAILGIVILVARPEPAAVFAAFGVGLALNAILMRFLTARVSKPISEAATAIQKMAAGDLTHRFPISGDDEVAMLGASLNAMSQDIGAMMAQLREGKRKVESVVAAMTEGVIVLDRAGKITLTNSSFRELSGIDRDLTGQTSLDVFRVPQLETAVRSCLAGEPSRKIEFTVNGRVLEANVTAIPHTTEWSDSVVVVLHDLTAIRRAERMRRDFVANVSHEFKTPLTAICGYTETLLSGGIDDKDAAHDFLRTIERNGRHLETLVNDLLTLARLEAEVPAFREPIAVKALIDDQLSARRGILRSSGLNVLMECPDVEIDVDRPRLTAAISNLIDNAIQYNVPNGEIRISAQTEKGYFRLAISNTGQGIPSEDLPRIFERFYRVDKSRTRGSGGTGLGLAIVKHAVESQGGSVEASSSIGAGATFTILLPLQS